MTRVLTIVAHEDDDLLFINPDIIDDINAGNYCETIFITAGDASREDGYWQSRERGMCAAYAQMAGGSGVSEPETITMLEHDAVRYQVTGKPKVSLVFLRLTDPVAGDNYQGLMKLWDGSLGRLATIDGIASYSKPELIDVLHDRMVDYKPDIVRTLDCTIPFGDLDHSTHTAAALFAKSAHIAYNRPHEFIGYQGYGTKGRTVNVASDGLAAKESAYFTYDPFDIGKNCGDTATCSDPDLLAWMKRKYIVCREKREKVDFTVLEGDEGSLSGRDGNVGITPTAVVFNSKLYAFYYDESLGHLRYGATTNGTSWNFGVVDNGGNVGLNSTAIVYGNKLHIFYYDIGNGELRHAFSDNGTDWQVQSLDGDPGSISGRDGDVGSSSAATIFKNNLELFYYGNDGGNLRHAWFNGTTWDFEDLEGTPGSISGYEADIGLDPTTVVYKNSLQVFYYDATKGVLRHAWNNDTDGWQFENLDGDSEEGGRKTANVGINPASVIYSGSLQLFYRDESDGGLRHAWADNDGWHFETLEGGLDSATQQEGSVGITPHVVVGDGELHVVAYSSEGGNLRHYWSSLTMGWQVERLDGEGDDSNGGRTDADVGIDPFAIAYASRVYVFYYDVTNGNLRMARL